MPLVLAFDDIKPENVNRKEGAKPGGPGRTNSKFFRATREKPDGPSAYLVKYDPGRTLASHFHQADQFQIITQGTGTFGRHKVSPYCVHFARAYTPYGPLLADEKVGWSFLTLRTRFDPGNQKMPDSHDKLKQIADRRPWQISRMAAFPAPGPSVNIADIPDLKDEQGLLAKSLTMAPNTRTTAPDPSTGDGQYIVVLKGSLMHDQKEHKGLAVAFVKPDEAAFQIQAGPQGLEGLILNFPEVQTRAVHAQKLSTSGFKKWQCELCAFAYDEAVGMPDDGIPPGTRWQDVPESWSCPDCAAAKSDFQMVEVG